VNRYAAARLARKLMDEHGLQDWKIVWTRAKNTHGQCCYSIRTLKFSAVAFDHIGEAEVRNTILHEIAHALAGAGTGHGWKWQQIHRQIGGTGQQFVTKTASVSIPAAWIGECPNGHKSSGYHRAPLRVRSCGECSPRFDPRFILSWKHNGRRVCIAEMPQRYRAEVVVMNNRYGVKF
jgi:predicted SprT family Zn-dependent metalloprotease